MIRLMSLIQTVYYQVGHSILTMQTSYILLDKMGMGTKDLDRSIWHGKSYA